MKVVMTSTLNPNPPKNNTAPIKFRDTGYYINLALETKEAQLAFEEKVEAEKRKIDDDDDNEDFDIKEKANSVLKKLDPCLPCLHLLQALIDLGADVNSIDPQTRATFLMRLVAASPFTQEHRDAFIILKMNKVDTTLKNQEGQTAMDIMEQNPAFKASWGAPLIAALRAEVAQHSLPPQRTIPAPQPITTNNMLFNSAGAQAAYLPPIVAQQNAALASASATIQDLLAQVTGLLAQVQELSQAKRQLRADNLILSRVNLDLRKKISALKTFTDSVRLVMTNMDLPPTTGIEKSPDHSPKSDNSSSNHDSLNTLIAAAEALEERKSTSPSIKRMRFTGSHNNNTGCG